VNKWIAIVLLSISAVGCKQGIGERCQVNADCAEGVCSSSEQVCVTGAGNDGEIDATPPPDAAP
jgi:hypothetical protein